MPASKEMKAKLEDDNAALQQALERMKVGQEQSTHPPKTQSYKLMAQKTATTPKIMIMLAPK